MGMVDYFNPCIHRNCDWYYLNCVRKHLLDNTLDNRYSDSILLIQTPGQGVLWKTSECIYLNCPHKQWFCIDGNWVDNSWSSCYNNNYSNTNCPNTISRPHNNRHHNFDKYWLVRGGGSIKWSSNPLKLFLYTTDSAYNRYPERVHKTMCSPIE